MDTTHPADHNQIANALTDIVNVLGSTPNGASATVQQRIETIEANNWVTNARMADNSVNTLELVDGAVTSAKILDGTIVNADVSATAAITYSKLSLAGSIVNADLSTTAGAPGGAWVTWTPTWSGLTVGASTIVARYLQVGKTVHFMLKVTLSGATVGTPQVTFTLPVAPNTNHPVICPATFADFGNSLYSGNALLYTGSQVYLAYINASGILTNISASAPIAWGNTDIWSVVGSYEAA
jgi:hypothetical protein